MTARPFGAPRSVARKAANLASEADRRWFADNPARSHRVRTALPREMPDHKANMVAVRQVQPGFRLRMPFGWAGVVPPFETAPEHICAAVYDLVERRVTPFDMERIARRAEELKVRGLV